MFLFVVLFACLAYGLSLHVGGQIGGKRSIDMPPNQEVNDAAAVSYENGNLCVSLGCSDANPSFLLFFMFLVM